uniref:NADH dehydrogenase subunit 4L n=1 Tax=Hygrobates turcicus TaxID=2028090 RepID=UPI002237CA6E|nr:NADH dehydrogenase subunit 4L [Hygrobates turcicus]UYS90930.1 NADH dehydrogenase subunit 4L [Hygrobates turcicus]
MELILIFLVFLFLGHSNSLSMIFCILTITILGVFSLFNCFGGHWLIFMLIFTVVGGLMVIYIFVLSLNSNEPIESGVSKGYPSLLVLMSSFCIFSVFKSGGNLPNKSIYENFFLIILFSILLILMTMYMSSKLIMNVSVASKSMK